MQQGRGGRGRGREERGPSLESRPTAMFSAIRSRVAHGTWASSRAGLQRGPRDGRAGWDGPLPRAARCAIAHRVCSHGGPPQAGKFCLSHLACGHCGGRQPKVCGYGISYGWRMALDPPQTEKIRPVTERNRVRCATHSPSELYGRLRLRQSPLSHCRASSPRLEGYRPGDGRTAQHKRETAPGVAGQWRRGGVVCFCVSASSLCNNWNLHPLFRTIPTSSQSFPASQPRGPHQRGSNPGCSGLWWVLVSLGGFWWVLVGFGGGCYRVYRALLDFIWFCVVIFFVSSTPGAGVAGQGRV